MQLDKNDIQNIEFLTSVVEPAQFFARLHASLQTATAMRAAIAYWTVEPTFVHSGLADLLSADRSFVCIDIQLPTSIAQLAHLVEATKAFARSGTVSERVFLHLRIFRGRVEVSGAMNSLPRHLLHPKLLLLDRSDGSAEIWVGSHNWTKMALTGANIEASIILTVPQTSSLYIDAARDLAQMQALCSPFNLRHTVYYQWLQGLLEEQRLCEFEYKQSKELSGQELMVFVSGDYQESDLRQLGQTIYCSVYDEHHPRPALYRAEIRTTSKEPRDIADLINAVRAHQRLFVVHHDASLPIARSPSDKTLDHFAHQITFGATIQLIELLPEWMQVQEVNQNEERWQLTGREDAFQQRLKPSNDLLTTQPEYEQALSKVRTNLKVFQPVDPDAFLRPYQPTLAQLRGTPHPELFLRKFVNDPS